MALPFGPPRTLLAPPRRLDRLTSLRWFAALLVFFVHAYELIKVVAPWYARSVSPGAAAGVSFFFMLSGFVLAWAVSDRAGPRAFWQNRLARIWPSHIVALAAALLLPLLILGGQPPIKHVIPEVFLLHAWIPRQAYYFAPNTPSWSLSCELFFYAMFPVVHRLINAARRPVALLAALIAVIWVVPLLTLPLSSKYDTWAAYIFPLARLPEFCIGIVLCRLVREGRLRWTNTWIAAAVAFGAIMSSRWIPLRFTWAAWTAIPLAWLLAASAARAAEGRRSWLDLRPLVWLGEISFAFYLVHLTVLENSITEFHFLRHGTLSHAWPLLIVELAASIVAAWMLHRLVELPFERRFRARRFPRTPNSAPVAQDGEDENGSAGTPGQGADHDRLAQPDERTPVDE